MIIDVALNLFVAVVAVCSVCGFIVLTVGFFRSISESPFALTLFTLFGLLGLIGLIAPLFH